MGVTVRQWAALYMTAGKTTVLSLDDAQALLMGSVRDNLDARLLLSGDYMYAPTPLLGLTPSPDDNVAFSTLEQRGIPLMSGLQEVSPQWQYAGYEDSAGLLTTRGFAQVNYAAGTNRRAVRSALESFLCRPIDTWRVPDLPTERIRQDVDRVPGETREYSSRSAGPVIRLWMGWVALLRASTSAGRPLSWIRRCGPSFSNILIFTLRDTSPLTTPGSIPWQAPGTLPGLVGEA